MCLEMTQNSQRYRRTVTHVVLNNFTLVSMESVVLLERCSSFQNAHHVKSDTCLIVSPYTCSGESESVA